MQAGILPPLASTEPLWNLSPWRLPLIEIGHDLLYFLKPFVFQTRRQFHAAAGAIENFVSDTFCAAKSYKEAKLSCRVVVDQRRSAVDNGVQLIATKFITCMLSSGMPDARQPRHCELLTSDTFYLEREASSFRQFLHYMILDASSS